MTHLHTLSRKSDGNATIAETLLRSLVEETEKTPEYIGQKTGLGSDKSGGMLLYLYKRGLVYRSEHRSEYGRRTYKYSITEKGLKALRKLDRKRVTGKPHNALPVTAATKPAAQPKKAKRVGFWAAIKAIMQGKKIYREV